MKKIIIALTLFSTMIGLTSCSNNQKEDEVLINGNKSSIVELNNLYLKSDDNVKTNNFITLVYQKDSICSNYFMVDSSIDLYSDIEVEVEACDLIKYDSDKIKTNDGYISEDSLEDNDVLILYTINNEILSTYPVKLVVESLYKLDVKANIKLDYSKYIAN